MEEPEIKIDLPSSPVEIKLLKCDKTKWNWKSLNELASDSRRVHSKLKKIDTYENGICLLLSMIVYLFEHIAKKRKDIIDIHQHIDCDDVSFYRVRDLIYGDIVSIGQPFNCKTNKIYQRSLKMCHAKYLEFFKVIATLNKLNRINVAKRTYKYSHDPKSKSALHCAK